MPFHRIFDSEKKNDIQINIQKMMYIIIFKEAEFKKEVRISKKSFKTKGEMKNEIFMWRWNIWFLAVSNFSDIECKVVK